MLSLKYLRTLSCEELQKELKYNREWQLKWFGIYDRLKELFEILDKGE